jgi:drug/metabolite transporter (DMT)-like permease
MATFLAYIAVVLIWATTPLAIQWSSDSISFVAAVLARMSCALLIAVLIAFIFRKTLSPLWQHPKIHLAASIGIFPNMLVVYWAAQFIPSGLVAVIFALSPFATGIMSVLLLKENPFSIQRILALFLAIIGLITIFFHQLHLGKHALFGIGGILLSCLLFSFSSVWVKKLTQEAQVQIHSFYQTTGALLFSLPGLLLSWLCLDATLPEIISTKSAGSIIYLAVVGSLIGGAFFFFILQQLSVSIVSLVTLMTPVLAIVIGKTLASESLSIQTLAGVGLVLFGLLVYLPWTLKTIREWLTEKMMQCLKSRSLSNQNYDDYVQKVKENVLRHK